MRILSLLSTIASVASAEEYYNVLAMDGGGIRGLIPAVILQNMEKYAYDYATKKGYTIPPYLDQDGKTLRKNVVAMKDLFDMTAGTSTGSILASGLAYPLNTTQGGDPKTPMFFAKDLVNIYQNMGGQIFMKQRLPNWWAFFWVLIFLGVFGATAWFVGHFYYDNKETKQALDDLIETFTNNKKKLKAKLDPAAQK